MAEADVRVKSADGTPLAVVTVTGLGTPGADRTVEEIVEALEAEFRIDDGRTNGGGPEP